MSTNASNPALAINPEPLEALPKSEDGLIYGLSVEEVKSLAATCMEARKGAYCPYSNFRVGASLLLKEPSPDSTNPAEPHIITGANVENASYPVGTCAERVAMGHAVARGFLQGSYKAVGVATDMHEAASPCGMCRQFLREFLDLDTPIFMFTKDGKYSVRRMKELLPMSFGPEALAAPRG